MLRFSQGPAREAVVINKECPFASFDLELSAVEQSEFAKLSINKGDFFSEFALENDVNRKDRIRDFLINLGNPNELSSKVSLTIQGIIDRALEGFSAEAALIELRSSMPNKIFDIPRWHFDGNMYPSDEGQTQAKFVLTAKGPGTLFHPLHSSLRSRFTQQLYATQNIMDFGNRKLLDDIVHESDEKFGTKTKKSPCGNANIFIVGPDDYAAVHSEPPIDEPRLFISVIPGNKLQIEEMKRNREKMAAKFQGK